MRTGLILIAALAFAHDWQIQDRETTQQSYPAAATLDVDNVNGRIHVTGYSGNTIQVAVEKVIRADSAERAEAAKREVRLDVQPSADRLRLYVDGPFRGSSHSHSGYEVTYNFDIQVPGATAVRLKSVNGSTAAGKITGDFDLSTVNGSVRIEDAVGSGTAHTVNGAIHAAFARNPQKEVSFKTLNGSIDATFQPGLSTEIQVKTMNGAVYTDFDAVAAASTPAVPERRNGRFTYRSGQSGRFRIGSGGPELKFETLNGSIRILKQGQ